jgi:RHH-type transcriptional regulator, rel operon repressor / antitoxin RelB
MSETMTVRLEDSVFEKLEQLAKVTTRTRSFLAAQAISEFVKTQEWQLAEIEHGIKEADAGELVSHEEIVDYWKQKYAHALDKKSQKKS